MNYGLNGLLAWPVAKHLLLKIQCFVCIEYLLALASALKFSMLTSFLIYECLENPPMVCKTDCLTWTSATLLKQQVHLQPLFGPLPLFTTSNIE
jgi:hypothetical protein